MRERLIELLMNTPKPPIVVGGRTNGKTYQTAGNIAEYLLENGVIVLPCKVGQMVYVIEPCNCYNNYGEVCNSRRTKATKCIEIVKVSQKHHNKCLKLFERPFKVNHLCKLGKTVFFTKEEAEKALKGGEG